MKNIITYVCIICLGIFSGTAQNHIYKSNNAQVNFDAAKSNIEPIKAVNTSAKIILDIQTGEIASVMNMVDFEFANKLMQEHFNENYIESDKYPKATFTGKIIDFSDINFSKEQTLSVKGTFKIHGKSHKKTLILNILKQDNTYQIKSNYNLQLKDFNIKIPSIMFYKIAEEVEVNVKADLKELQ